MRNQKPIIKKATVQDPNVALTILKEKEVDLTRKIDKIKEMLKSNKEKQRAYKRLIASLKKTSTVQSTENDASNSQ